MLQFFEFVGNNWLLVGVWVALIVALVLHSAKTAASAIAPQQAVMMINRQDALVLDIRDKKDYDAGHIVDSLHIPYGRLKDKISEVERTLGKDKSRPVVVICKMGQHSGEACKQLSSAGFQQVVRLRGGMAEWRSQGLPLVQSESRKADANKKSDSKQAKKKGDARKSGKKAGRKKAGATNEPEALAEADTTTLTEATDTEATGTDAAEAVQDTASEAATDLPKADTPEAEAAAADAEVASETKSEPVPQQSAKSAAQAAPETAVETQAEPEPEPEATNPAKDRNS